MRPLSKPLFLRRGRNRMYTRRGFAKRAIIHVQGGDMASKARGIVVPGVDSPVPTLA